MSDSIEQAINQYDQSLQKLENGLKKLDCLSILTSRDAVKNALQEQVDISEDEIDEFNQQIERLLDLDRKLKQQETKLTTVIDLDDYRQHKSPAPEDWWWYLKHPLDRWDWLFNIVTLVCLGFSFAMTSETISLLVKSQGNISLSIIAAIQTGLTLWIGQSLLRERPGAIITFLINLIPSKCNIAKHLYAELISLFAIFIAFFTFIIRVKVVPLVSNIYNEAGITHHYKMQPPEYAEAFRNYQKSINIDPNYIDPQYHLGRLYEDLTNEIKAKEFYEKALLEDYIQAYNNFGRLLILEGKYQKAIKLLERGYYLAKKVTPKPDELDNHLKDQYNLLKNLAWVNYELGKIDLVRQYTDLAFEVEKKTDIKYASAHCLRGLILRQELLESPKLKNEFHQQATLCQSNSNNEELNKPEVKKWQEDIQKDI